MIVSSRIREYESGNRNIMTMSAKELEVFHRYMKTCSCYLEFGSGESTLYAAGLPSVHRIDSVESSQSFVEENLKRKDVIREALASGKLLFHYSDIGETSKWGYPINRARRHLWPRYSFSVFAQRSDHDLVLVDGRFRVACTLNSVLHTPPQCRIVVHDFWNREEYHVVLPYLNVLERVDTLGVFVKKDDIDLKKVGSLITKYQYLPDDKTFAFRMISFLKRYAGRLHI